MNTTATTRPTAFRASLFASRALLIGFIALRLGAPSHAQTIFSTYIGPEDGAWEDAANWSPAQVPGNFGGTVFNVIGNNYESILLSSTRTIQNLELSNETGLTLVGGASARLFTVTGSTSLDHSVTVQASTADATMNLGTLQNFDGGKLEDGEYDLKSIGPGFATLRFNGAAITLIDSAYVSLTGANTRITNQAGVDALTNLNRIAIGGALEIRWGRNFTTTGNFTLEPDADNDVGTLAVRTTSDAPTEINTTFTVSGLLTNYSAATSTLTGGSFEVESGNGGQVARIRFANTGITTLRNASVTLSGPNAFLTNLANLDALANLSSVVNGGFLKVEKGRNFTTTGDFTVGADSFGPGQYVQRASIGVATSNGGSEASTMFTVGGSLTNYNPATKTLSGGSYELFSSSPAVTAAFRFANTGVTTLENAHVEFSGANSRITNLANQDAFTALTTIGGDSSLQLLFGRNLSTPGNFTNHGYLAISAPEHGGTGQEAPLAFVIGGSLTNFNAATKTITGGDFAITDGTGGSAATLKFTGADIIINRSSISLDGPNAKIVNELNQDALRNLATNEGYLAFEYQHNFTTVGTFSNTGSLRLTAANFTASGNFTNTGSVYLDIGNAPGLAASFTVSGLFTNYAALTKTLTGGGIELSSDSGSGQPATFKFTGADIRVNESGIFLAGASARIVNQFNNDALANLEVNGVNGYLGFEDGHNFVTSGNFTNLGTLNIVTRDEPGTPTMFVVSGIFNNYNPATKTLTGGRLYLSDYGSGWAATFKFTGADIQTNRSSITLEGPNSNIVNQVGADGLANLNLNDTDGEFHLWEGHAFVSVGDFVNAGLFGVAYGGTATISGNFTNSGSATFSGHGAINADNIINDGVIRADGGILLVTAATITGAGSFEVINGTLRIDAGSVTTGDILVSDFGTLELDGSVTASSLTIGDGGIVLFGADLPLPTPAFGRGSSAVPEPGSAVLLMAGLAGCLGWRKRGMKSRGH